MLLITPVCGLCGSRGETVKVFDGCAIPQALLWRVDFDLEVCDGCMAAGRAYMRSRVRKAA